MWFAIFCWLCTRNLNDFIMCYSSMTPCWQAEVPLCSCSVPVTSSSAVLVACPDPLVACTVYLPLLASVTVGITSLARPSLNEICTPGRLAAERTWPSRYQFTSGTGKPTQKGRQTEIRTRWNARHKKLPECTLMYTQLRWSIMPEAQIYVQWHGDKRICF